MSRTTVADTEGSAPPSPTGHDHASRGTKAIVAAFCANLGIAVAKFIGFLFTGSGSMLAESVHSVVDTGDQALLMLGGRRARKKADEQHPFGYGRERFFWAFMVAVVLFTLGGAFAVADGIDKLLHPHELERMWWAIGILGVAMVLEGLSFRTALLESRKQRREGVRLWRYIRNAKAPEVPVVLLEDAAALAGLVIAMAAVVVSHVTGDSHWDGYGTIAIGGLLGIVAVVLATEMKSLLIGESASANQREAIGAALHIEPAVVRVIHVRTEHLGPEELLVGAKVEFLHDLTLPEVAEAVNRVEANVRANVPEARVMYIEPDVSRDRIAPPLVPEHTGTSPDDPTPPPTPRAVAPPPAPVVEERESGEDRATLEDGEPEHDHDVARLEAARQAAVAEADRGSPPPEEPADQQRREPWPPREEATGPSERADASADLDELLKPQQMPTRGSGARRRRRQAEEPTQTVARIDPPDLPDS
jgi:cation diffusion facilitator family transporter